MSRADRSNVPSSGLRWSPESASPEFGASHVTIRAALAKASERPGQDGLYSTQQIVGALHGNMAREKLKTQIAIRKRIELKNRVARGELVDRAALVSMFSQVADSMCSRIRASSLTRDEQCDLLRELSSIPISIESIAAEQSRLPRGHQHDGDDDPDDPDDDLDADLDADDIPRTGKVSKRHFRRKPKAP